MADTFRVTTYEIESSTFSATTYDLTLNNDLEANYFALVNGGGAQATNTHADRNFCRVTQDPFGTGDLGTSSGSDVIRLEKGVSSTWRGSITIIECLGDEAVSGFELKGVVNLNFVGTGTSDTANSTWSDINQVGLYGGERGGGVTCASGGVSAGDTNVSGHARIWPSTGGKGAAVVNGSRDLTGGNGVDADFTVYVVEWGSDWTIQRVNLTGSSGGAGANATGEYDTAAITSVVRDNTFVLGYGHTTDGGIGDSFAGCLVTLGDGVSQLTNETTVAAGGEYSDTRDIEVYIHENSNIAVDYVFKVDGDSASTTYDHTVDAALGSESYGGDASVATTEGYRFGIQYNGCNGTGNAFPRPYWGTRHTASGTLEVFRIYTGQNWPAWVQSIDTNGVTYTAANPRRVFNIL